MALACHPERSEGPVWMGVEMLRYAQDDRAVMLPRYRHLRTFRLLLPLILWPTQALLTTLAPPAFDGLFLG